MSHQAPRNAADLNLETYEEVFSRRADIADAASTTDSALPLDNP